MKIALKNIGKQYKEDWVFRNVNYEFFSGESYAIIGPNGSGKSTLINIISTHLMPTIGNIIYSNTKDLRQEDIFRNISICSPYLELIEEFTLTENFDFFFHFKKLLKCTTIKDFVNITDLHNFENKTIGQFSSGMKQRVKLALAILADVPVVLLDEPCTNLDVNGISWYNQLVSEYLNNRLIIVSSNDQKHEFEFCTKEFSLINFK